MSTVLQGSRCLCVAPLRPWDTSVLPSSTHTHYLVDFVFKRSNHSHTVCAVECAPSTRTQKFGCMRPKMTSHAQCVDRSGMRTTEIYFSI